jgi:hypothetical protein
MNLSINLHIHSDDHIRPNSYDGSRWIKIGDDVAIFAPDAKLIELRNAIDAYLADGFAKRAEAA